jgi:peptidoglycan/xylan/chitin deacetylase (PgdA/CDA1 family)
MPWVAKGNALEDFDDARMNSEFDEASAALAKFGVQNVRAYAYPCGMSFIGEDKHSYVPLVKRRFAYARGVGHTIADPRQVDLLMTPGFDGSQADLTQLLKEAESRRGWLIIVFHGVGREYMNIPLAKHEQLLDALAERRSSLWTAPFSEVAAHVASVQQQN